MIGLRCLQRTPLLVTALSFVAACAQTYQPIVDMKGVDQALYAQDLAECRIYAEQVSPAGQAVAGALVGAAAGAAIGAATGAAVGQAGYGASVGAASGGSYGTFAGAAHGVTAQITIIRNCLFGRGYKVLY